MSYGIELMDVYLGNKAFTHSLPVHNAVETGQQHQLQQNTYTRCAVR